MASVDVGTLANLATALTLVGGLIFGVIQVRHARQQRQDAVVLAIMQTLQTPEVARPARAIMNLPPDVATERIVGDPELRATADQVILFFEGWGLMVHSRLVDLHALDRAGGGAVRGSWRRLRGYVEWQREQSHDVSFGEWFQWLAERMHEDPAPGKAEGAHVAYRNWSR